MGEETNLPSHSPRVYPVLADIKRGRGCGQGKGIRTDFNNDENKSCTYNGHDINKPLLELHKATSHEHPDLVDGGRRFVYRWILGDGVETIIGRVPHTQYSFIYIYIWGGWGWFDMRSEGGEEIRLEEEGRKE